MAVGVKHWDEWSRKQVPRNDVDWLTDWLMFNLDTREIFPANFFETVGLTKQAIAYNNQDKYPKPKPKQLKLVTKPSYLGLVDIGKETNQVYS